MKHLSGRTRLAIFIVTLTLILVFGVGIAVQTRKAIQDTAYTFEDVKKMKVRYDVYGLPSDETPLYDPAEPVDTLAGNFYINNNGISMNDVYDRSDVIVKVQATDERSFLYSSILTKVTVLDVYKGDQQLKSGDIYVYEWAQVDAMNFLLLNGTYNIMNTGDSYYLFLSRLPMPRGYNYTPKEMRTYLLTNVYMGKYNVKVCDEMKVLPRAVELNDVSEFPGYSAVKRWDILPVLNKQLEIYLDNRKAALVLLGIEDDS